MKTQAIQAELLNNYNKLAKIAKQPAQKSYIPIWGLQYQGKNKNTHGFISELGEINLKKSQIQISNNQIKPIKKPFFSTWKGTLKKMNNMIKTVIENYNNPQVVKKNKVNIAIFKNI